MKRCSMLLVLVLALVAGLAPAARAADPAAPPAASQTDADHAAADDHGHEAQGVIPSVEQGLLSAITALLAFFLVLFILSIKVWPKITGALEERAGKIREEIAAAEAARAQARDALEEYERSLAQARAESQKMLDETKAKQAELAAELRAKADAELAQMRERAMRDIEGARKAALAEIYDEAVGLATAMASKILQREVTASDDQRLVEESLAELQTSRS